MNVPTSEVPSDNVTSNWNPEGNGQRSKNLRKGHKAYVTGSIVVRIG
jgi:hypothetical protein